MPTSGLRLVLAAALFATALALSRGANAPTPASRNANIKWVNEPKPGTLPERVTHRTFASRALGREGWLRLTVGLDGENERFLEELASALRGVRHSTA